VSIYNHIQKIYSSSFVHFPGHATLSHAAATTPARAESAGGTATGGRRTAARCGSWSYPEVRYAVLASLCAQHHHRRSLKTPRPVSGCSPGTGGWGVAGPVPRSGAPERTARRCGAPPESHRTTGTGQVQRSWTQAFRALLCTSLTVHYPAPHDATACGERAKRRMVPYPPFSAPCCAYALWTYARDVTRPLTLWSLSGGGVRMLTTFARCPTRSHLDYMSAAKPPSPPPPPPP